MRRTNESLPGRVATLLQVIALVVGFCFVVLGAEGRLSAGFFSDAASAYATAPVVITATISKAPATTLD